MQEQTEVTKAVALMSKARSQIICKDAFFASLALRLVLQVDEACETMWTDGIHLGFNPLFVNTLTTDEVKAVVVHEVLHCANKHHVRRNGRNAERWNVACDYAINYIVSEAGYYLPYGALLNEEYANMSAEMIYDLLPEDLTDRQKKAASVGGVRDYDPHNKGKSGIPASESEMAEEASTWNMALNNAERAAKAAGTLKGFMSRLVDQLTEPIIPWREVLARFVQTEVSRNDYSWQRANVRHMQRGFILPSLYSATHGKVAVAVDTSGSATSEEIKEMLSEVIGILELYEDSVSELTVPVIYADYAVCDVEHLGIGDEPHPKGGGGTDYVPVFDWIDDSGKDYAALIYMTDGYCESFPNPGDVRVPTLWALTRKNDSFNPPFGETLTIRQ